MVESSVIGLNAVLSGNEKFVYFVSKGWVFIILATEKNQTMKTEDTCSVNSSSTKVCDVNDVSQAGTRDRGGNG